MELPTHFIDGTEIPLDYFDKLKVMFAGLDAITEADEEEIYHDPIKSKS